jgi:hypothetical protein
VDRLTLGAARNLGTLATDLALKDFLGDADTSDFYRFSLSQSATATVNVTSGDDDFILELIHDANNILQQDAQRHAGSRKLFPASLL